MTISSNEALERGAAAFVLASFIDFAVVFLTEFHDPYLVILTAHSLILTLIFLGSRGSNDCTQLQLHVNQQADHGETPG